MRSVKDKENFKLFGYRFSESLKMICSCCQNMQLANIVIKHNFPCINIYWVPREVLKTRVGKVRAFIPPEWPSKC